MKKGVLMSLVTLLCAAALANAQESKIPFTVTGLEIGKPVESIKAEMPNECFTLTGMTLYQDNLTGNILADQGQLFLNVAVSDEDTCANNGYAKLWRENASSSQGGYIYSVNGSPGLAIRTSETRVYYRFYLVEFVDDEEFVDDDDVLLKQELVGWLLSATAPEVPEKPGITFLGWSWSFVNIEMNMTLKAKYHDNRFDVAFCDASYLKPFYCSTQKVVPGAAAVPPELPVHKGMAFEGWDSDFSNINNSMTVYALYTIKEQAEFVFNVTGFDFGSKAEDIHVETPNECFDVAKKIETWSSDNGDQEVESVDEWVSHTLRMSVSVTCDDDSLGNIWRYFRNHPYENHVENVVVNGNKMDVLDKIWLGIIPVTFVDYDGTVLKQEMVQGGRSATPPEVSVREGYVFKGWDWDFSSVWNEMTITALYEEDYRHVVFESVSGETIRNEMVQRGESVYAPTSWSQIGIPEPSPTTEYVYDWRRIGDSGDEIVQPQALIVVGDSVHYRAEIIDTLYLVLFFDDVLFNLESLKGEMVHVGGTTEAPEAPVHKGIVFDKWNKDFSKITEPTDVRATYKFNATPEYAFKVTGFDFGSKVEDIKVDVPNECFEVKKQIVWPPSSNQETESVSAWMPYGLKMSISVTCDDDSLANIWKLLLRKDIDNGEGIPVILNGKAATAWSNPEKVSEAILRYYINPVTFVDDDWTELKKEMVAMGESATAPEDPVHEGYVFTGWNTDFSEVMGELTVRATYEEDLRHVVFESVSGEVIFEDEMRRGSSVFTPSTLGIIGVPISTKYVEYVYKWHRIGESGDEYVNPNSLIEVGDSVHYRAEVLDTLYRVSFWDTFIDGGCVKEEMVSIGDTVELPEPPYHKGLIFDGWEAYLLSSSGLQLGEATDFPKVTGVMSVGARYKTEPGLKLDFNLSGYEFGKTVDDIEVETPNEYFKVTKTMKNMYGNEVSSFEADSVYGMYVLEMKVSVEDVDDSLVNAWKYIHRYSSSDQVVSLSTSIFKVEFYDFNGTLLKQELVVKGNPAIAPEEPSHKGIVFKGWMGELDSITMPVSMWAEYEVVNVPEYAFTATGFEAGEATKDIKIETPNDCFTSSIKSITLNGKDEFDGVIRESGNYTLYLNVAVADTGACAEDSLVNVAKVLGAGKTLSGAFTVNGETAHYDGSAKKGVLVYGRSIVVAKSSSSEAESSSSEAKSSSNEAKSSSSSENGDSSSSSSEKDDKSSSSKGGKDAIFAVDQLLQFSVTAMGRDIQIAGARKGSAYAVFDMQGHVLRMDRVDSESFSLSVPHSGTYLVRVGNQTRKVTIK